MVVGWPTLPAVSWRSGQESEGLGTLERTVARCGGSFYDGSNDGLLIAVEHLRDRTCF